MQNSRLIALKVLQNVIDKHQSLTFALTTITLNQDQALIKEIANGVLRWYFRLDALANRLLRKPFKQKDSDIHLLLLIGLYQILYLRVPDHAAVNETVNAIKSLKKTWAVQLVNGVLRNFIRQQDTLIKQVDQTDMGLYAHPQWLLNRFRKDWPKEWQAIAIANNHYPPMTLRVNLNKISKVEYLHLLSENQMPAFDDVDLSAAITLETPVSVTQLPGFEQGLVSVQDGAAQLAADLLDIEPNLRVLDACAAPGGKTAHILEKGIPLQELIAIDVDADRLQRIRENFDRIGQKAHLLAADAGKPEEWWDGQGFDRILLDAPCSATGVIRRHPDIKLLRQDSDIKSLAESQYRLLTKLWPLLKLQGIMLYATCSVLEEENEAVIKHFLTNHTDVEVLPISISFARSIGSGIQILPGEKNSDGFYYCKLKKI